MKPLIIALALLAGCYALKAEPLPEAAPKVIIEFNWNAADIAPFTRKWPLTGGLLFPLGSGFTIGYHGADPISINLRTVGAAVASQITSRHYAILGKLKTTDIPTGSYLEMVSYFAPAKAGDPEGIYFSRTLSDSGPSARLESSNEGRDFLLPFEATDSQAKLTRLVLNLYLAGPGGVELSDVKLVQYPEAPGALVQPKPEQGQVVAEGPDELKVPGPGSSLVWGIKDAKITETRYAVIGEVRYENTHDGSLEMYNTFASEKPGASPNCFLTSTLAAEGPLGLLQGTSDWRPFWLPFDSSGIKGRLITLWVDGRLSDAGPIYLRHLKLVQYPDGAFPLSLAPSGQIPKPEVAAQEIALSSAGQTPSEQSPVAESKSAAGIDWKSFWLGVAATILLIAAVGSFSFLSRRLKRRRKERELRRIASLDS